MMWTIRITIKNEPKIEICWMAPCFLWSLSNYLAFCSKIRTILFYMPLYFILFYSFIIHSFFMFIFQSINNLHGGYEGINIIFIDCMSLISVLILCLQVSQWCFLLRLCEGNNNASLDLNLQPFEENLQTFVFTTFLTLTNFWLIIWNLAIWFDNSSPSLNQHHF